MANMVRNQTMQREWDLHSARKLRGNERMVLIVKNALASAQDLQLSLALRLLWKHL